MFLDDSHRPPHPLCLLLPALILLHPLSFCLGTWVEATRSSFLRDELLRGNQDPEQRSRWSDGGSDVYHIGERVTTCLFVTDHIVMFLLRRSLLKPSNILLLSFFSRVGGVCLAFADVQKSILGTI